MNISSSFAVNFEPYLVIILVLCAVVLVAIRIPSYNWLMLFLKQYSKY